MAKPLTDAQKIRRLPWLIGASLSNSVFCVLTFTGAVFILFLNELGLDKSRIGFALSLVPFSQIVGLFAAPMLSRIGLKRGYIFFFGLRKLVFSLMLATPLMLTHFGTVLHMFAPFERSCSDTFHKI